MKTLRYLYQLIYFLWLNTYNSRNDRYGGKRTRVHVGACSTMKPTCSSIVVHRFCVAFGRLVVQMYLYINSQSYYFLVISERKNCERSSLSMRNRYKLNLIIFDVSKSTKVWFSRCFASRVCKTSAKPMPVNVFVNQLDTKGHSSLWAVLITNLFAYSIKILNIIRFKVYGSWVNVSIINNSNSMKWFINATY